MQAQACNGAFCERKRATVVGSQRRMRSRHQARRGSQARTARSVKPMLAEMMSFADVSETFPSVGPVPWVT